MSGTKTISRKTKSGQISTPLNTNPGCTTPSLHMAVTRR